MARYIYRNSVFLISTLELGSKMEPSEKLFYCHFMDQQTGLRLTRQYFFVTLETPDGVNEIF